MATSGSGDSDKSAGPTAESRVLGPLKFLGRVMIHVPGPVPVK